MADPPIVRMYNVREKRCGWARFFLTSDGCLAIVSDYGNYAHWWGSPGCEIREFLTHCDIYYVSGKFSSRDEYDDEATAKGIREYICRSRRDGGMDRERAREEWRLLERYSRLESEEDIRVWAEKTTIRDYWEYLVYRTPMRLQMFMQKIWPQFIEQLKLELAEEARAKAAADLFALEFGEDARAKA